MKTIIVLTAIALTLSVHAADNLKEVKARVGNYEILRTWNVGVTKVINGISVTRVAGENTISGRTNLLYSKADTIINGDHIYGFLHLFLDRESQVAADGIWMNISVSSAEDPFLMEHQIESTQPHPYRYDIWYNFISIPISKNLPGQFSVTVHDGYEGKSYEFSVTQPEPTISKPVFSSN